MRCPWVVISPFPVRASHGLDLHFLLPLGIGLARVGLGKGRHF